MKTKKELKEQYKHEKPMVGVFQVLNKVNGKILIEGSTNILSKWNRHRTELRFGSHRNKILQNDWKEMGEDNFIFSIISELEIKEDEKFELKNEVHILKEMLEVDMNIKNDMKY